MGVKLKIQRRSVMLIGKRTVRNIHEGRSSSDFLPFHLFLKLHWITYDSGQSYWEFIDTLLLDRVYRGNDNWNGVHA